ncbi:XrtA/PEP-CTERM system-associated ATPase [Candidatus Nitrosacidococcus sp. I8]|uniref:XrtA/PEP-CTERM system-associated ATPase n=1 Tax=Candidatus Nitrosacidococcus sp. I8 TaxID=2942908 RepID=UPI002226E413|nr:XrtA/PEP-CTERM system-associated ATPase [Candidatus Nitrosacidococcus sp. I8]CAH9019236.1 IS481 family transposase ISChy3 [Candidatus Nitrosacidococcus sp. I8]
MYQSFYNLTGRAFQLSVNPQFFYGSTIHKRAISYLRYGLMQGEGFIAITGPVGTGKSMLVQMLISELENDVIATQIGTTQLESSDMLRYIAASYHLTYEGLTKAALLKNLESFLINQTQRGRRVLLIVDEAQDLPSDSLEELRLLSNFQINGKALLQCFLLGQNELRQILALKSMEHLRQRIIAAYHLSPLGREETQGYIEHRLKHVGWHKDPVITSDAYQLIYKHTQGIPRRINIFCERLLLHAYTEELHTISEDTVQSVIEETSLESFTNDSRFSN